MDMSGWRTFAIALVLALGATACSPSTVVISEGSDITPASDAIETAEPAPSSQSVPSAEPSVVEPVAPVVDRAASLAPPPDALEGPNLDPRGMSVVEAPPALLPAAFSTIEEASNTGLYYSATDGQMSLVAFDANTLTPRYQVPASPLGRIRGVGQQVLVDGDLGLVFVTGYDDAIGGETGGYLAGHDAATGEELWRTSVDYYAAQPFDCGDKVCIRTFGRLTAIDKASGSLMQAVRVTDRRLLHSSSTLTITTTASMRTGDFTGIVASSDFGFDSDWEITATQFNSATGHEADPSFGWRADLYPQDNVVLVHLARIDDEGWASAAVDTRTGVILWNRSDISPCIDSPTGLPAVVCVTGDDPFVPIAVQGLDLRTGDTTWTRELPDTGYEFVYDGTKVIAWWYGETEGSKIDIDPATGDELPPTQTALCIYFGPWHDFEYPDGEVLDFASGPLYTMCSSDGFLLYPDEVLTMAPTLDIETDTPLWLIDFDGIPLTSINN